MSFIPTPTLCTDFYKECHFDQYNPKMTRLVSYYTPRMSRTSDKTVVNFGLQYYIKSYLIDDFSEHFFKLSKAKAVAPYARMMAFTMGKRFADTTRWEQLWEYGRLPLEFAEVPEGTKVPMGCPSIRISNIVPMDALFFMWLVNFIETGMSTTLWHMGASANVGNTYYGIVKEHFAKSVEDSVPIHSAIGDFSMRGQQGIESSAKSSAAFLLSSTKTATIPAIEFLEKYYNCNIETELVATGLASTEHSVETSNAAIDGDEKTHVIKLLSETYPEDNFVRVWDSYDYFGRFDILEDPQVKALILAHKGFMGIRGDSGDPVEIVCGKPCMIFKDEEEFYNYVNHMWDNYYADDSALIVHNGDTVRIATEYKTVIPNKGKLCLHDTTVTREFMGTIESVDKIFGHTINSKGYKVLNEHVKVVYGDGITPDRARTIYSIAEAKGYAANNVILGMGSYSLESAEGNTPLTRDTYSVAIKSTYGEYTDENGKTQPLMIFKDPISDTGHFKKSQKGCIVVKKAEDGTLSFKDQYNWEESEALKSENLLQTVFYDGVLVKEQSLKEIRNVLHEGFYE